MVPSLLDGVEREHFRHCGHCTAWLQGYFHEALVRAVGTTRFHTLIVSTVARCTGRPESEVAPCAVHDPHVAGCAPCHEAVDAVFDARADRIYRGVRGVRMAWSLKRHVVRCMAGIET